MSRFSARSHRATHLSSIRFSQTRHAHHRHLDCYELPLHLNVYASLARTARTDSTLSCCRLMLMLVSTGCSTFVPLEVMARRYGEHCYRVAVRNCILALTACACLDDHMSARARIDANAHIDACASAVCRTPSNTFHAYSLMPFALGRTV